MKAIKTEAIITSIRSKVDRSLSLTVHTPELTSESKAVFMDIQGQSVSLLIEPKDEESMVYTIDKKIGAKTPSQRLRSVLFVNWKQVGEPGDFEIWYRDKMEKIIDVIKTNLNPL